ncbi:unnamed protein product [Rotaria sp. Silwood1]|nr:unnamed protein product [Rotaria sp. Silwood1]CAF3619529.1 unnamed protein product [Rotaria sp. Silwood1]CAF3636025.1 unnamed protein product [Rotaria sp. Silwood1]CAF3658014.1 unnamed protein product [Rotaria sp. Silwood1]CAF4626770.1 unnamed protein product [Rotaria sp. Silwood1]
MAEHIDKNRLNNNLRYRFDYVSKFLNFTKEDIGILNTLAPIIFPRIPFIVETIYKKLYTFDITKKYFLIRNDDFDSFSSNDETNISVISAQTDFRKDMLSVYLKRILIQTEWNDLFLQYLSQIGEIHTESDHTEPTHIDYIHINSLFGYLEHILIDIIWNTDSLEKNKKCSGIRAINKVFWIQNDFFTMHYGISFKQDSIPNNSLKKQVHCSIK